VELVAGKKKPKASKPVDDGKDDEAALFLEVSPEPKLGWQCLLKMHLTSLTDSSGAELPIPAPYFKEETEFANPYASDELDESGQPRPPKVQREPLSQHVCFRIPRQKDGVKKLASVTGIVSGEILTSPEHLMTMGDILNAAGKTATGPDGETLTVVEVKRGEAGTVSLKLLVTPPTNDPEGAKQSVCRYVRGRMRLRRGILIGQGKNADDKAVTDQELALVDAKGNGFRLARSSVRPTDNSSALEYTVEFEPQAGLTVPARLTYTGQRRVILEVPFTLKDVPLP
jgi:hypothetical protein